MCATGGSRVLRASEAVFEWCRLPTPFGLVRSGVAPDHPDVKSVQKDFETVAEDARLRCPSLPFHQPDGTLSAAGLSAQAM